MKLNPLTLTFEEMTQEDAEKLESDLERARNGRLGWGGTASFLMWEKEFHPTDILQIALSFQIYGYRSLTRYYKSLAKK
jgi:hypothetical protein